jgi:5-amino-6-(5-phosphoribosylamino)uracil reductase
LQAETALRLYPPPCEYIDTDVLYRDLDLPSGISINMVSTVDGRAVVDGEAQHISSKLDRDLMKRIRAAADTVATGAQTIRSEKLNLTVTEDVSEKKPLPVVFTSSGEIPADSPIFKPDHPTPLIFAPASLPETVLEDLQSRSRIYRLGEESVGIGDALRVLCSEFSAEKVLLEGGPSLSYQAISCGLVRDLFLTLSPKLAAGENPLTTLSGDQFPKDVLPDLQLLSAYLFDSQLFLRYRFSSAT